MGRKNKKYKRNLREQVYDRLMAMLRAGEGRSKSADKQNDDTQERIYSYNSLKTYRKHCNYFVRFIMENHPECTTLKAARKYVNEWLQYRTDWTNEKGERLSAWTIQTERQALAKLYGITPEDKDFFQAPRRKREDIKRSRGVVKNDGHFSQANNFELIQFCKSTGCRRNVLERLEGRDLFTREELRNELNAVGESERKELIREALELFSDCEFFIWHYRDKGGKSRFAPIIGPGTSAVVERMRNTKPTEKVWNYVSKHADVHSYRSDYATQMYKRYARQIEDIPYDRYHSGIKQYYQSEVYVCRLDEEGKRLDRKAMLLVSKSLGHNRVDVIASHYLRGI